MKIAKRYQLRRAGGLYWLLDMEQPGIPYRKPFPINDIGAEVWQLVIQQGLTRAQAARHMHNDYGVPEAEVLGDINEFLAQLVQGGILVDRPE